MNPQKYFSGFKPENIATSDTLAEELTMVIVVVKANITSSTMVHTWFHINIAFHAEVAQSQNVPFRSHFLCPSLSDLLELFISVFTARNNLNVGTLVHTWLCFNPFFFKLFVDVMKVNRLSDTRFT